MVDVETTDFPCSPLALTSKSPWSGRARGAPAPKSSAWQQRRPRNFVRPYSPAEFFKGYSKLLILQLDLHEPLRGWVSRRQGGLARVFALKMVETTWAPTAHINVYPGPRNT